MLGFLLWQAAALTLTADGTNKKSHVTAQHKGVWTVSGIYRGESIKGLPSGVYIVDGVKMLIK